MAIKAGSTETVRSALDHGLDPNLQDAEGNSILLCALRAKQFPICLLLLERGANPGLRSTAGISALDLVAELDGSNILKLQKAPEAVLASANDIPEEESAWISEESVSLPDSDIEIAIEAEKRQSILETWSAIDHDDSWDDIEICLPSLVDAARLEKPLFKIAISLANIADQFGVIDPATIIDHLQTGQIDEDHFEDTFIKIEHLIHACGFAVECCLSDGYSWSESNTGWANSDRDFHELIEATLSNPMTSIGLFQKALSKCHPITRDEERALFGKLILDPGNHEIRERIILSNLRFAYQRGIAFSRENKGVGLEDRISEAVFGILIAIDKFDISRELKFISYAVHWMRQRIQKTIQDNAQNIRIPPNKLTLLSKFQRTLLASGGDINAVLAMEEFKEEARELQKLVELSEELSLEDLLMESDEDFSTSEITAAIGVRESQDLESEGEELVKMLSKIIDGNLTEREAMILRMYHGIDCAKEFTYDEIGRELRLTRERIRQLHNKSLNKLKKNRDVRDILLPFLPEVQEK